MDQQAEDLSDVQVTPREKGAAKPQPDFYLTPAGRVVASSPRLHQMVTQSIGKYGSYAPCDKEGNPTAGVGAQFDKFRNMQTAIDQQRIRIDELMAKGDEAYQTGIAEGRTQMMAEQQEAATQAAQNAKEEIAAATKRGITEGTANAENQLSELRAQLADAQKQLESGAGDEALAKAQEELTKVKKELTATKKKLTNAEKAVAEKSDEKKG